MKAFGQALTRKCDDKGLVQFGMFCFGLVLNTTIFEDAKTIFHHMCIVFDSKSQSAAVDESLEELRKLNSKNNAR